MSKKTTGETAGESESRESEDGASATPRSRRRSRARPLLAASAGVAMIAFGGCQDQSPYGNLKPFDCDMYGSFCPQPDLVQPDLAQPDLATAKPDLAAPADLATPPDAGTPTDGGSGD